MLHRTLTLASLFVVLSCTPPPAEEPDPTPDEPTPEPVFMGADPAEPADAGTARAGVIRDGEAGDRAVPEGMAAEGKAGDLVLWNDRARFVVQGAYPSHGYVDVGGVIIDADIVRPEGQLGRDAIDDMVLSFGVGRIVDAHTVEVVNDGTDGNAAVVRAIGTDVRWEMIHGVFESDDDILPPLFLDVTTEYRLEPDTNAIAIETTWVNQGTELAHFNPVDGFVAGAEDQLRWSGGRGFGDIDGAEVPSLGIADGHGGLALGFFQADGDVRRLDTGGLLDSTGIRAFSGGWRDLEPGDSDSILRYWAVGEDTLTVERERWLRTGVDLGEAGGTITDADTGEAVAGARVFVRDPATDEVLGHAVSDAAGAWSAALPAGTYEAWAVGAVLTEQTDVPRDAGRYGPFTAPAAQQRVLDALTGASTPVGVALALGRLPAEPVDFTVALATPATEVDAALPAPGTLSVSIEDDSGDAIGAIVEVRNTGSWDYGSVPGELRGSFALPSPGSTSWGWTGDGSIDLVLPAGTYDLVVSHSWRHERATLEGVVVEAGGSTSASAVLEEVVARDGWVSVDSHLHAAPSTDGKLSMEDRLVACAAAGVDLPVNTDHDRMADYRPLNTALGLDDRMQIVPGLEVSSVRRGHFNLFPVAPDPAGEVNGGALSWWQPAPLSSDEHAANMRGVGTEDSLIQINHGRGAGAMDFASFDHTIGEPRVDDFWTWDYDVFELVNGTSRDNWLEERQDWFSWLDVGQRKVPTGVSDSHNRRSPCGYAHSDVRLDAMDPTTVTSADLAEGFRSGGVVVSGGITLRAELGGLGPGEVATGSESTLDIRVLAPSWIVPSRVRVWRNSAIVWEQDIDGPAVDGLWLEASPEVSAADEDAWFVVEVEGDQSLGSWWGGARPYAITNALYLDADGDGWDPPGRE